MGSTSTITINTNLSSLTCQKYLRDATKGMNTAMERLSIIPDRYRLVMVFMMRIIYRRQSIRMGFTMSLLREKTGKLW